MTTKSEVLPNPDRKALARVGEQVRARLLADPGVYRVPCDAVEMFTISNFLDAGECAAMMALIDDVAKPSHAYDLGFGTGYRTSYSGDVERSNSLVQMVERRIDDCLGLDPSFGEAVQGQRYAEGQEYRPHNDWFWPRTDYWKQERLHGGQRCWTAMIYLNEVEEGGETHFTRAHMSIPPQPGLLLMWNNAKPDGALNIDTMHAGEPVLRGTKYIITKWYRTRKWG